MTLAPGLPIAREPPSKPNRRGRLASTLLGHLPFGVAVIDTAARLLYWNEHAAGLFGIPPIMAADMPPLADALAGVNNLTQRQREGIIAFGAMQITAGDRVEPESCLRLSLTRGRRIVIQALGIGSGRWMLVIDDGRMPAAAGRTTSSRSDGVAWLDPLTGLSNRRHFNEALRDLLDSASSASRHALLMIDLDRFRLINETLGHAIGDALLCIVGQRLARETREEDLLARLGGDEFVILMTNGDRAESLAGRVIDILSRPFLIEGHVASICASVGIAAFPDPGDSGDDVVRRAEVALYEAKSAGQRTCRTYNPAMAAQAGARQDLEIGLRTALAAGELSLAYLPRSTGQPQVLTGFVTSPRWNHPVLGDLSPVLSTPAGDRIGCVAGLDEWALNAACMQAARWPAPLAVIIDISPHRLLDPDRLCNGVDAALAASGLAPERLELRIGRSALAAAPAPTLERLDRLRDSGVHITVGAFGAGYEPVPHPTATAKADRGVDYGSMSNTAGGGNALALLRAIAMLEIGRDTERGAAVEATDQKDPPGADGRRDVQGRAVNRLIPAAEIDAFVAAYKPALDHPPIFEEEQKMT